MLVLAFLILLSAATGCTGVTPRTDTSPANQSLAESTNSSVQKIEVYHFHGNKQCASCIAVGDLAEKTLQENFRNELGSGRIVFAHVNYDLPNNTLLKEKYGVSGSSLWIGVYGGNRFSKEQDLRVWSLINDEDQYSAYLTAVISKRLNGDLS
ncbi:nitrophenyl compound nitroreductase subunit ArsF family protein [Methanoregula sp. PtaB.Bin085]|uniref:nitrophenyl compound nitroreductase subunit ArsF family protein n=1 Tax=Methanoregula sp. PtaB.Bin085 TaxID=1811680 RepID=UPI0009D5DDD7|nr:nitrophenyl compound nitroreductase subunit ArsF family protein [Methanoregula sp. PtaB.Bin085]OPX64822.1 MAG: hypothetical protein A4E33_00560 [Methanoregula sp. PtaB.Bin085]